MDQMEQQRAYFWYEKSRLTLTTNPIFTVCNGVPIIVRKTIAELIENSDGCVSITET